MFVSFRTLATAGAAPVWARASTTVAELVISAEETSSSARQE